MNEEIAFNNERLDNKWPKRAILAFTKRDVETFQSLMPGGSGIQPILGGMTKLTRWSDVVLAGPILGAPQAAMVIEILSRRGVEDFLSLGWCGSLQPSLTWGDVVLPLSAVSEEGTSAHYSSAEHSFKADLDLCRILSETMTEHGVGFTDGGIWTTDAPFRETREKVEKHSGDGLLAVEMETSAIMAVAAFRKVKWAGLLVVSDELWGEKWRPGFNSPELKSGLETAAKVIITVLKSLQGHDD